MKPREAEPIGEVQVGPTNDIRFKVNPPAIPGDVIRVRFAPTYSALVRVRSVAENGYALGSIERHV